MQTLEIKARRIAASVLVTALVLTACGGGAEEGTTPSTEPSPSTADAPDETTTTTQPPLPPPHPVTGVGDAIKAAFDAEPPLTPEAMASLVTFHFADDVSPEDRDSTQRWMALSLQYWGARAVPVSVWVGHDDAWMVDAYVSAFEGAARSDAERIYAQGPQLGIAGPGVIVHQRDDLMPAEVLFHEYVHVMQGEWSGRRGDQMEPCWLTEGMATLYGKTLAEVSGIPTDEPPRFYGDQQWVAGPALLELGCDDHGYNTGALAVEYLMFRYGEQSTIDFFSGYRPGVHWTDAFAETFGLNVEDFAVDFATHRAELSAALVG